MIFRTLRTPPVSQQFEQQYAEPAASSMSSLHTRTGDTLQGREKLRLGFGRNSAEQQWIEAEYGTMQISESLSSPNLQSVVTPNEQHTGQADRKPA